LRHLAKSSKSLRYSRSAKRKKSNKFSFGKKNNYWEDGYKFCQQFFFIDNINLFSRGEGCM
jgi:hypothetical protein